MGQVSLFPSRRLPTGSLFLKVTASRDTQEMPPAIKELELWSKPRLLAQLISSYPVKQATPLYWYCLNIVCVDGVLSTFAQKIKPV
jgi:hypothetical protein